MALVNFPTMPDITFLSGRSLLHWAECATDELVARRVEINSLNVFPVPDADTGSNMAHTMHAAVEAVHQFIAQASAETPNAESQELSASDVATALASGAVRGARGNSGVVLSQVLRGIAQAANSGVINAACVQKSLLNALDFVAAAITDPVEGTVITVLRAAAFSARSCDTDNLYEVVTVAAEAARVALHNTPSQLTVLREAGVVDAGGQGLVILLDALVDAVLTDPMNLAHQGESAQGPIADHACPSPTELSRRPHFHSFPQHEQEAFLEVMFYIEDADLDALRGELFPLGDSLVIAGIGKKAGTIHIHTCDAGRVIEQAYAMGRVSDLRIEVLPSLGSVDHPTRIVLALAPEGTLAQLYSAAGALVVVRKGKQFAIVGSTDLGQEPTPLTDGVAIVNELISRSHESGATEVILLPNGMLTRGEMASVERSTRSFKQSITILPTGSLVRGLAALSMHDSSQALAVDTYAMAEAITGMRTAKINATSQAALTVVGACAKGDYAATMGSETIAVNEDIYACVQQALRKMLDGGGERVTIIALNSLGFNQSTVAAMLPPNSELDLTIYLADHVDSLVEIGVE